MARKVSARRHTLHRTLVGLTVASAVIVLSAIAVPSFGGPKSNTPSMGPVPKAHCGPGDHTESGLQGETTHQERFSGDSQRAYNCNLELVGQQPQGEFEGAFSQDGPAYDGDCAYYGTRSEERRVGKEGR